MKKICIILSIVFLCCNISAQKISVENANKAGKYFLKKNTDFPLLKSNRNQLDLVYTSFANKLHKSTDSIPCFYVFNSKSGGFVIVSASLNTSPILAYSDKGSFDISNIPENFQEVLYAMKEDISYAITNNISASSETVKKWENLLQESETVNYNKNLESVSPLTETIFWDQWPYFNDSCPVDSKVSSVYGKRCPTGCTATAMAIVIRYWKYPERGHGSHEYTHKTYGTLSANFEKTHYNYDNMPKYMGITSRKIQRRAVSQLLYHCGVATNMSYGPDGSGAYVFAHWNANTNDAKNALKNYFGYTNTKGVRKNNYTDSQWRDLLKSQLMRKQPLIFSGYGHKGSSGHAFVCDGFDANNMFHFNWGWSGKYNCYCTIDSLCPGGVGTGGGKGNYSTNQSALIDINPYLESVCQGWIASNEYTDKEVTDTKSIVLQADTCLRILTKNSNSPADIHSIGSTFDPTSESFPSMNNKALFRSRYRIDSLHIFYNYHIGEKCIKDSLPDTLMIYMSYYEPRSNNNNHIIVNEEGYNILCPKTDINPIRPSSENMAVISYVLSYADADKHEITIPLNLNKSTALGFDVPEDAVVNTMLRFAPAYKYKDGDTLSYYDGQQTKYIYNSFEIQCWNSTSKYKFIDEKGYNSSVYENNNLLYETCKDSFNYAPLLYLLPKWNYHIISNIRPTAAYVEIDTSICGSANWNGLKIIQDGDYTQIFTSADNRDSVVILHVNHEDDIGEIEKIIKDEEIDDLGSFEFKIDPVSGADTYKWKITNPEWIINNSDSTECILNINKRGQGTLSITAFGPSKICKRISEMHIALCDSVQQTGEIKGTRNITKKGIYKYSIDSVDKATSYLWKLKNSDWYILSDSTGTEVQIWISSSHVDTLRLYISDECGYVLQKSIEISCSSSINETISSDVTIYPNPTDDIVRISLNEGKYTYKLTDACGKTIKQDCFTGDCKLSLQNLTKGIYFICIREDGKYTGTYKIVKL